MKVYVLSKQQFDKLMRSKGVHSGNVETYTKYFFISINDTSGTTEVPYFENKSNVKILYFDDVETDLNIPILGTSTIETKKAFTEQQATELIQYLDANKDKETCFVHCAAGISRSGAVGEFVNDYFGGDYFEFKKNNPLTKPNGLVLRILKKLTR